MVPLSELDLETQAGMAYKGLLGASRGFLGAYKGP